MKKFIYLIVLFLSVHVYANGDISVTTQVDRDTITIGDRVNYTVKIEHSPEVEVPLPRAHLHLEAFEILEESDWGEPKKDKDGNIVIEDKYVISTFTTGDYVVPPYQVDYVMPTGATATITSASHLIKVESVSSDIAAIEDVQPVKSPVEISVSYEKLVWGILGGLLALAAIIFGIWWYRKRRREIEEYVLPVPPYELAVSELRAIEADDVINNEPPKIFALRLSGVLKKYIMGLYGINAPDLTTYEIRENMPGEIKTETEVKILSVLDDCDLVKFAKVKPEKNELQSLLGLSYEVVEDLKPVENTEEENTEEKVEK